MDNGDCVDGFPDGRPPTMALRIWIAFPAIGY